MFWSFLFKISAEQILQQTLIVKGSPFKYGVHVSRAQRPQASLQSHIELPPPPPLLHSSALTTTPHTSKLAARRFQHDQPDCISHQNVQPVAISNLR